MSAVVTTVLAALLAFAPTVGSDVPSTQAPKDGTVTTQGHQWT